MLQTVLPAEPHFSGENLLLVLETTIVLIAKLGVISVLMKLTAQFVLPGFIELETIVLDASMAARSAWTQLLVLQQKTGSLLLTLGEW